MLCVSSPASGRGAACCALWARLGQRRIASRPFSRERERGWGEGRLKSVCRGQASTSPKPAANHGTCSNPASSAPAGHLAARPSHAQRAWRSVNARAVARKPHAFTRTREKAGSQAFSGFPAPQPVQARRTQGHESAVELPAAHTSKASARLQPINHSQRTAVITLAASRKTRRRSWRMSRETIVVGPIGFSRPAPLSCLRRRMFTSLPG